MRGNGFKILIPEMAEAFKFGWMDRGTKAIGKTTRLMEWGDSYTLMAMSTKESGKMIKLTARVSTHILMALDMKGSGEKISSMDWASRDGQMGHAIRELISMAKSMEKASLFGQIRAHTLVISMTTTLKVEESMNGQMEEYLMEIA